MEEPEEYFLSAKNDFLFKRIFGNEDTHEPLCSLLSAVLGVRIISVSLQNPLLPRLIHTGKESVLDIRAHIDDGTHVNIEMQVYYHAHFMKRTQFYLAKLYDSQLSKGNSYTLLQRAIVINVLCYGNYELPGDAWHHVYILKEKERNEPMPDEMLELHFIELEKMKKCSDIDETDTLTLWGLFMNAESTSEMEIIAKHDPAIYKAYTIAEELARNEEERMLYEAREKFLRDQLTNEEAAEERGRTEGMKEGIIEAARKMIAAGMDPATVCNTLGISQSDLR